MSDNLARRSGDEEIQALNTTFTPTPTTMSLALKATDVAPTHQAYRLSAKELKLRNYFIAAFTDVEKPVWALRAAVWNVTDELKTAGEYPEAVIKRIKYIAAIPISFHYRNGYKEGHSRLTETVAKATSFSIERYFTDSGDD